ncbi:phage tail sheath family protein [Kineosporia babensis]|uniref:Phage tail sheath subtilisin-like domain-containing protein n=1 Tax=Kineosporia babensis TaxID=499548 RepID=A0A9X1N8G3_9ACTN|nr:phage tail sheath subtilisin-like domain-containing protein [Kineosporia babensis]MCD5310427.1 phage tail sheath subtilisin-like domain-containing protein [Kineosporia babensis]
MPTYTAPGVYVEEVASTQKVLSAAPTAVAAFVGFTERFPMDDSRDPEGLSPRLVTSWQQFESLYGSFVAGAMLPLSVYAYFQNGGQLAYIVRVPHTTPAGEPSAIAVPAADRALGTPLNVESIEPDAPLSISVHPEESSDPEAPLTFRLDVHEGGETVESYPGLTLDGPDEASTKVNGTSTRVKVKVEVSADADLAAQLELLKPGHYELVKAAPTPVEVTGRHFAGSATERKGLGGLAIAEDVTMVILPDLVTAATKEDGSIDLGLWKAVQTALIAHCEQYTNRMAILDSPPGMGAQQIKEWRSETAMYDSAFAAMYYPWVKIENPIGTGSNKEILVPPSGHVAGLWARTDQSRGVWKAPANDTLRGVLDIERAITQNEQSLLNPIGINCIRPFGVRGIRVWGARTLASDTDWTYINVRRLFNMAEKTIQDGTQWAVFEPNDVALWEGVKRTLTAFLRGLWTQGALVGATPDQAFYVKCDEETNPPEGVDAGQLVVEVGLAPVKPAEFVIFRIAQQKQTAA